MAKKLNNKNFDRSGKYPPENRRLLLLHVTGHVFEGEFIGGRRFILFSYKQCPTDGYYIPEKIHVSDTLIAGWLFLET
jgi:hypothetical protein